jgi:hypothetical protein
METVTVSEFVAKHGITMDAKQIESRPDGLMMDSARHFKCILKNGSKRLTVYFSQGLAWTTAPEVDDVLGSLSGEI